jgi:adenylate kinase
MTNTYGNSNTSDSTSSSTSNTTTPISTTATSTRTSTATSAPFSKKLVVIGGIPGVGKTSVISAAVKTLNEKGQNAKVVVFGTEMFEEAKRTIGIKNRDELRKLSLQEQRRLQEMAALRIAKMQDSIVIVDTHIFVRTGEGYYYPGLPMELLQIMKPTGFIMIAAKATEIVNRRKNDTTRNRDEVSEQQVQYELEISKLMVATCSILTGAPFIVIQNNDNKIDEAASSVASVLSSK